MSFPSKLLVSGNEAVRRQLSTLLSNPGTGCLAVADSLPDGLQQAKKHPPDIILLDARMAHLEVSQWAAGVPEAKRAPVVLLLLEGPCSSAQEQAWREEGAAGFLTPPFEPATFCARIRELAEQSWYARKLADLAELGGSLFVSEMIDAFRQLGAQAVVEIRTGLAARDDEALARTAHSLKSAAANLGAEELRELAIEMEHLARNNATPEVLEQESQKLTAAFDRAREFLQRRRGP